VQGALTNTVGRVNNAILGKGFTPSGGTSIFQQGSPQEQTAAKLLQPQGTAQNVGNFAGNVAISAAGLATGNPESLGGAAAQMGALSAAQTGLQSLGTGNDAVTAAKDAFVSGLSGAAAGAAGKVLGNTVDKLATNAPDAFYNNALKVLGKIKSAGKSPAGFLQDEGVWGGLGAIQKAAQDGIGAENSVIKQAALNATGGLTYDDVVQQATKTLSDKLGDIYSPAEIKDLVESVPIARIKNANEVVPWVDVDGVRATLGNFIGDSNWLSSTPSQNTQAAEAVYGALSSAVKKATGTTDNFARLSKWITTQKVVGRAANIADNKYGLGLLDTLSGGAGALAGFGTGNTLPDRLKNAAVGGASAFAVERGVNSPALKTGLGLLLSHIGDLPVDEAGKITKSAVVQLINEFTKPNQANQPLTQ
jgi:hypothetical protein